MLIKFFKDIPDHPIFIITAALILGVVFAENGKVLFPYVTTFLAFIFFLSALKLDLKEVRKYLFHYKQIVYFLIFSLILLPVLVYYPFSLISKELATAFLILVAMPAAMSAPIITGIYKGKQSLAIVLTTISSICAVFTIPLLFSFLLGQTIELNTLSLFMNLVKIIIVPIILAEIVKYFFDSKLKSKYKFIKPISILFLGLAIFAISAGQGESIIANLNIGALFTVFALTFLFIFLQVVGYFFSPWKTKEERVTVLVCTAYINLALAIYIAATYFQNPAIVLAIILSEIPWILLMGPMEWIMTKKKSYNNRG